MAPAVLSISKTTRKCAVLGACYSLNHDGTTLHSAELKYAPTQGKFPSFWEIDKTAGAYSLQSYDYLSQIQRKTNCHFG